MDEHIGKKLYAFRMSRGWSKRKVAIHLGVSIPSIMRWEDELCIPNDYNLHNIRNLLGIVIVKPAPEIHEPVIEGSKARRFLRWLGSWR